MVDYEAAPEKSEESESLDSVLDEGYSGSQTKAISLEMENSEDDDFIKEYLTHKPDLTDFNFNIFGQEASILPVNALTFEHL